MDRVRRSPEPVIRLVAHGRTDGRLFAELHAAACEACGATMSAMLEYDAPRQCFAPAAGADGSAGESWLVLPDSLALAFDLFACGHPQQVSPLATALPDLASHLPGPAAILAPIVAAGRPLGLLALVVPAAVPALEWMGSVSACADGFALALDRARHEREAARQHAADTLLTAWSRAADVEAVSALQTLCAGLAGAFAADRVTFWTHDRVGQRVTMVASSDASHLRRPASTPTADTEGLLVKTLRTAVLSSVAVVDHGPRGPAANVAVPLRGLRRALGVIVLHGMRTRPGDDAAVRAGLERLAAVVAAVIDARRLLGDTLGTYRDRTLLRDRLGQAEALSHLVAGIAHDVNNPLQAVIGHLELAARHEAVPAALAPTLTHVTREACRAARIVRQLLVMAGAGRLRRRRVSVARAVTGAIALRKAACKRAGIVIRRSGPQSMPAVAADAVLLRQVVLNLLLNAEHAVTGREAPTIEVAMAVDGPTVTVTVRDNGPGLPGEAAWLVFEPFHTTRESGTGLGLTLVQRVVQEFGGAVAAANHPEGGAVFTVSLPVLSVVD